MIFISIMDLEIQVLIKISIKRILTEIQYSNAIIINKKEWVVKMPIPFSHIFLMNYHVVPWNTLLSL